MKGQLTESDKIARGRIMSLQDDINLLIKSLKSLQDFKYVKPNHPLPYGHMGATITEAILQAGTNYSTVVKPRVMKLLDRGEGITTDGFQDLLIREGARKVLNWEDTEKPKRIHQLTGLLSREGIQNELDLKAWMQDENNIEKLEDIRGIGNKTIDYLRILTGISTTAVDRHIFRFLMNAKIQIGTSEYDRAKSIVNETATQIGIDSSTLDYSIWSYMSTKSGQQQNRKSKEVKIDIETDRSENSRGVVDIGPYDMNKIFLCSADASPTAQKRISDQAQYFFPGAKWVGALRNTANRLSCDFFIITTAHGMVDPTQIISPYDMHINEYPDEVEAKWRTTIPAMMGTGRYKLMIFYAGGCPRDEMLSVMLPILAENKIDLLTFGGPNMYDVGKIDKVVQLLISGTSISEIMSLLKVPDRLMFYHYK